MNCIHQNKEIKSRSSFKIAPVGNLQSLFKKSIKNLFQKMELTIIKVVIKP